MLTKINHSLRYLYLLFDTKNYIHGDQEGISGIPHRVASRSCFLDTGGYIFNTEAHPMDVGALDCCHGPTDQDIWQNAWFPKQSSTTAPPDISNNIDTSDVPSTSPKTCAKPSWQSVLWVKLPPKCLAPVVKRSWSENRRKSQLYTLLTCEAAHFMERLCIAGEVCDI